MRIICQLSDQIAHTFCRCFVTSRFVTFASVLINEHPARTSVKSLTTDKIRPNFDIFATNFILKLSINRTTRFNRIDFPLIVDNFNQTFSEIFCFKLGSTEGHLEKRVAYTMVDIWRLLTLSQLQFKTFKCLLSSLQDTFTGSLSFFIFLTVFLPVWGVHWFSPLL